MKIKMRVRMTAGMMMLGLLAAPVRAADHQVKATVKGMVCAFCAQGIKKKFGAEEGVEDVLVDLDKHSVVLKMKDGKTIEDEKIAALLKDSGFAVEKIEK